MLYNDNYLNDRERGRHFFCRILAPSNDPSPDAIKYLTILLTEREGGRALPFVGFWRPQCPPPPPTPQYLTIS